MANEKDKFNKLAAQVAQYQKILHSLNEGYILVDEDAIIHDVNPAYCKMVGYTRDELLSMKLTELRTGMSLEHQKEFIENVIEKGSIEFETQHRRKNGEMVHLNASAAAIEKKGKTYMAGFVRNVGDQRRIQRKLEESEQRFRSLFKHNPHPVYYFDLEGKFKEVNEKLIEFTGYSREELLKLGFEHFIDEADLERTKEHFRRATKGTPGTYEIEVWVRDGKKQIRVTKFPMYINNKITGVYGILQDVTERRATQQKLKESEERWHRLVEENPKPVRITVDDDIVFINEAGVQLYEARSAEDLLGRSTLEFVHPEDADEVKERYHKVVAGLPVDQIHENRIITCKGNERFVEVHSVGVRYNGKRAIQTNIYDITDRKKEEQVIQSSLKEKKILLQEIHHRVKNNMAVISGLLELQAMNTTDENLRDILKESQMRIYSMAMIHEKLYASKSLAAIKFNEYAKELVEVIIDTVGDISSDVTVRFRMDDGELNINQAIPCGLILNELIVNCYKHAFREQEVGSILIGFLLDNGKVKITVNDNGVGLPDDFNINTQQNLGMKIIQTLTAQLEGQLDIVSGEDHTGTCFVLTFTERH